MTNGLVHFMHGKESGPGGSKIAALAEVARKRRWDVAILDYSNTTDPAARLAQLLEVCADVREPLLLVGSRALVQIMDKGTLTYRRAG